METIFICMEPNKFTVEFLCSYFIDQSAKRDTQILTDTDIHRTHTDILLFRLTCSFYVNVDFIIHLVFWVLGVIANFEFYIIQNVCVKRFDMDLDIIPAQPMPDIFGLIVTITKYGIRVVMRTISQASLLHARPYHGLTPIFSDEINRHSLVK